MRALDFVTWKDSIYENHRERCAGKHPIGDCWPPSPDNLLEKIKSQIDPDQLRMTDIRIVVEPGKPWALVQRDKF